MRRAVESAKKTIAMGDLAIEDLVVLMPGRLKNLKSFRAKHALAQIKKELREFDSRKEDWKQ